MTQTTTGTGSGPEISSDLEANRVSELAELLPQIANRIVQYVTEASSENSSVGRRYTPHELIKELSLELPEIGQKQEGILEMFDLILKHSVNTWSPGFMDKLYAGTNPAGLVSDMLLSILNTNSHVFTVSPALTVVEKKTGHEYAKLFGFSSQFSGGMTFPGGSYSNVTSLNIARSVLFPSTKLDGNAGYKFAVFASEHSHYSVEKACILLGLGSRALFKVAVDEEGRMVTEKLEEAILKSKELGYTPLYVNATAGTTVYGSFDPLREIAGICRNHKLWFHVDGSWGGNVVFSARHRHKLDGVELADSLTVNPHKMLGCPTTCSFLLVPDERVFQQANSLDAPYLFHNTEGTDNFDLADGTMGCGRRPDALKLFLGWYWFGRAGYEERIDHGFRLAGYLAEKVAQHENFVVVSSVPPPCLQVCFYYTPTAGQLSQDGVYNSKVTRTIAAAMHSSGKFLVDYAPPSGSQDGEKKFNGEFFRVVLNSPVVTSETIDELVETIHQLGQSTEF